MTDSDERFVEAVASFARGRSRKARRLAGEYLRDHPDDIRARLLHLRAEFALGHRTPEQAVAEGRAFLQESFASPEERRAAQLSFAGLLHVAGQSDEGRLLVESLLEEDPNDLRAHAVLGFFLIQADGTDGSRLHLRKALAGGYDLGSPDGRRVAYAMARKRGDAKSQALILDKVTSLERLVIRTRLASRVLYLGAIAVTIGGTVLQSIPLMLVATAICAWLVWSFAYLCWGCCTKGVFRFLGALLLLAWAFTLSS